MTSHSWCSQGGLKEHAAKVALEIWMGTYVEGARKDKGIRCKLSALGKLPAESWCVIANEQGREGPRMV